MRQSIALVVALLIGLQSVFVAAGQYCAHDAEAHAAAHFGHHEHQHLLDAPGDPDDARPSGEPGAGGHVDCAFCQLSFAKLLIAPPSAASALAAAIAPPSTPWRYSSAPREQISRPPKLPAA